MLSIIAHQASLLYIRACISSLFVVTLCFLCFSDFSLTERKAGCIARVDINADPCALWLLRWLSGWQQEHALCQCTHECCLSHVRQGAGGHKASHELSRILNWSFVFIKVPETQSHMKSWPFTAASPTYWREESDTHGSHPTRLLFPAPCLHSGPLWETPPLCLKVKEILEWKAMSVWLFYPQSPQTSQGLVKTLFSQWIYTEWMRVSFKKRGAAFTHSKTALNTDPDVVRKCFLFILLYFNF